MESNSQTNGTLVPLNKKTVLITGCSPGGIGHALAKNFHSRGFHVFATARHEEALDDLKTNGVDPIVLEVTNPKHVQEARKYVEERTGGRLDFLVNNAGRNYTAPALDIDFDEVQKTFDTNVYGVMRMCKEFSPLLVRSKGTIIQIGSVAADIPYVFGSVYNATKAALHAYSKTLRVELQPYDVKVMVVVTGGVQSNIARTRRELPEGSLYLPLDTEYKRRQTHSQEGAMTNSTYAEGVVKAALRQKPVRELWKGNKANLVWFVLRFMPAWVLDLYFWRLFNFYKIADFLKAGRKEN